MRKTDIYIAVQYIAVQTAADHAVDNTMDITLNFTGRREKMADGSILKYRAFLTVCDTGSFSKAAEKLAYSQSGISRMVKDLEDEWGVVLLERGKSGVALTSDGLKLIPFIRDICAGAGRLDEQVDMITGLETGLVRIGTIASVSQNYLPGILKSFLAEYPNIQFDLIMGEYEFVSEAILSGQADCGFLNMPAGSGLEAESLFTDEYKVVLPKDHPLAELDTVPLAKLKGQPFIALGKDGWTELPEIFGSEGPEGMGLDVRFSTWDDYAVMAMVESGLGVSILPGLVLSRCPYDIITKSLKRPKMRTIGIATKSDVTRSVAVEKFLDFVRNENYSV